MTPSIPETLRDLLERPIVVTLVTLMPDNQPQATPVWFNYDGEYLYVNSAKGRQKDKNMRARPQVTILSLDPQNPYRYLEVRGIVEHITEEGGLEHAHQLSRHYTGHDFNLPEDRRHTEIRVIYKIRPVSVYPKNQDD